MKTQRKILDLLHARSEQAIPELKKAYGGLCRSIASHALARQEDVEEVVSDAMFAVWNTIPPEQPQSLSAYIGRIVRNLSLKRHRDSTAQQRDSRMQVCLDELILCLPDPNTPESVLEGKLITQTINRFLAAQTKVNRIIFIRRYFAMDDTKTIARRTGMTDQAVRARLMRMRAQLRTDLEKEGIFV